MDSSQYSRRSLFDVNSRVERCHNTRDDHCFQNFVRPANQPHQYCSLGSFSTESSFSMSVLGLRMWALSAWVVDHFDDPCTQPGHSAHDFLGPETDETIDTRVREVV